MSLRALDHFLVVVTDLKSAFETYCALGFTVVPPQQHVNVGSANCVIQFQTTYFELFGQIDQIRAPKWRDFYMDRLSLGEGMGNISFTADRLTDEQARLRRQGLTIFEPMSAKRAVPLPNGPVLETDSDSVYTDNDGRHYLSPFFSEHRKPEAIFVPELQRHANGVTDVVGVISVSDDVEKDVRYMAALAEVEQFSALDGGRRLHLAKAHYVDILTADAVTKLYGKAAAFSLDKGGMTIGLVLKAASLDLVRSTLTAAGVSSSDHQNSLMVGHDAALGIFLQIEE